MFILTFKHQIVNLIDKDILIMYMDRHNPADKYACEVIAKGPSLSGFNNYFEGNKFTLWQGTRGECEIFINWLVSEIATASSYQKIIVHPAPQDLKQTQREIAE
jgi:hypothetical protein